MLPKTTLLGQVLEGLPPDVQSKLQDIAIAQNLDSDDPVFLASLVSGTHIELLNDILKTYPDEFDKYSQALDLWTQKISKLTSTLKSETRDLSSITSSSSKLIVILTKFLDSTAILAETLETNNQGLIALNKEQLSCTNTLNEKITTLSATLSSQQQQMWELKQTLDNHRLNNRQNQSRHKSWISVTSSLAQVLMGTGMALLLWFTFTDGKTIATQVDWGLTKLRRIECGLELRPASTAECHSIR